MKTTETGINVGPSEDKKIELLNIRHTMRLHEAKSREMDMRGQLATVCGRLRRYVDELELQKETKYTGWCVCLKRAGDKWECVAVVHPEKTDNIPEEFDLVLPIPHPESVPDFEGW